MNFRNVRTYHGHNISEDPTYTPLEGFFCPNQGSYSEEGVSPKRERIGEGLLQGLIGLPNTWVVRMDDIASSPAVSVLSVQGRIPNVL